MARIPEGQCARNRRQTGCWELRRNPGPGIKIHGGQRDEKSEEKKKLDQMGGDGLYYVHPQK
jgi:hypothetical protein